MSLCVTVCDCVCDCAWWSWWWWWWWTGGGLVRWWWWWPTGGGGGGEMTLSPFVSVGDCDCFDCICCVRPHDNHFQMPIPRYNRVGAQGSEGVARACAGAVVDLEVQCPVPHEGLTFVTCCSSLLIGVCCRPPYLLRLAWIRYSTCIARPTPRRLVGLPA